MSTPPPEQALERIALERIRAEFREMPDMRLTVEQIQRLCGLSRSACEAALESLVQAQFLCVTSDGRYMR
jgi:response regulator of citrate/malate metabolism